ncbi:AMP-binding protein [Candidatus Bathyarchaeota archaeon]|nr:AMP-binding protein [Candidatus Bathyarchaeota archaeon]
MTHAVNNWDTLSWEDQQELQDKKIRTMVQEVAKYHPAYKKLMKENDINPADINSVDDFVKNFPFTEKKDIAPTDDNPFKPSYFLMQKVEDPAYQPRFMIATTGRTSFSTPFWYTNWDLDNIMAVVARRVMEVTGMTKKDVIVNSFPYSPHLAFWLVYYATTGNRLTAIHTGGGKILGTQKIMNITYSLKGSVFVGVPGYMYHVFKTALGSERFLSDIRLLITGGDRCTRTFRKRIGSLLQNMNANDTRICAAYGFTESRVAPLECPHPDGVDGELTGYHTYPDLEFWYCIDPKTGERVGPGERGELVWTALGGRGTIVMNYRTGDIADGGIIYEKCPWCGRTVPRISSMISRRSEVKDVQFDKVKGTLIDLNQFYSVMPTFEDVDEWQVILKQGESMIDELIINVSPRKKRKFNESKFKRELMAHVKREMEITPNQVNVMTADEISRSLGMETQLKEKRILDLRPR